MSMTADLRDRLKAAVASGRVYRDERPQGSALPAVVLLVVSDARPSTYQGREQLRSTTVQVDCMGSSRGDADALAEAVIAAAEPEAVVGATKFHRAFVTAQRTYSGRDDADVGTFVSSLDLSVWHSPAI